MQPARDTALDLFYSYSHADREIRDQLEKHLSSLRRRGLIREWYDGAILAGQEWNQEIEQALARSELILLLISSDFLNSRFCYEIELPAALAMHAKGAAIVIPIIVRPVVTKGLPFTTLQMLPRDAKPVTQWSDRDQVLRDIAEAIHESIYNRAMAVHVAPSTPVASESTTQDRVLDAAIAAELMVDEPTDIVAMVRTIDSAGLRAILRADRTYTPSSEDVHSQSFELEFPRDPFGKPLPAVLDLAIESPGFDPPEQRKHIRVPTQGDSPVWSCFLTPERTGKQLINIELQANGVTIGSCLLRANCLASVPSTAAVEIVSMPVRAATATGVKTEVGEFTRMMPPPVIQAPPAYHPPAPEASRGSTTITMPAPGGREVTMGAPPARKKSILAPMMSAAAAVVVLFGVTTVWQASRSAGVSEDVTVDVAPPPPSKQPPKHVPPKGPTGQIKPPQPADPISKSPPKPMAFPVEIGKQQTHILRLRKVNVASEPAGAQVFIDGQPAKNTSGDPCFTPCVVFLPFGDHRITAVSKTGEVKVGLTDAGPVEQVKPELLQK